MKSGINMKYILLPNLNYQYKYQLTKLSNILNQTSILCKQSIISDNKYNYITVQLHKMYGEKIVYRNIYILGFQNSNKQ